MPIPLLPILAIASVGGGLVYLYRTRQRADETASQPALPLETFAFHDRGFVVSVEQETTGRWRWVVWRDGARARSGAAASKAEAISASVQWVSSRMLPPPKTVRTLPAPKKPPRTPTTPSAGADPVAPDPEAGPRPKPPAPVPPAPPDPPVLPPVEPMPARPAVVSTTAAVKPVSTRPRRVTRSGLRLEGATLTLTDLQQYVADAFGAFDPFVDTPAEIVTKMLQGILPELGVEDARDLQLQLVGVDGEKVWVADAIEQVGRLQHQLFAPDLDPQLVPFAADILAEGFFDAEQRISGERFAYRGRLIYAKPSGVGYRWSIRDAVGVHGPSELLFPTQEAAVRNAIAAISDVDEVAA